VAEAEAEAEAEAPAGPHDVQAVGAADGTGLLSTVGESTDTGEGSGLAEGVTVEGAGLAEGMTGTMLGGLGALTVLPELRVRDSTQISLEC